MEVFILMLLPLVIMFLALRFARRRPIRAGVILMLLAKLLVRGTKILGSILFGASRVGTKRSMWR